ncbi:MAG: winged helix-turn-helix transcriptional regulator [Candidatus Hydrogenedens sp.]|nr:winged helix-turn-helix transcriptional regulator [Candidatus Hydrogenedens sp.]
MAVDESRIVLGVLNAVDYESAVTQRDLARTLGVSLGLINVYLKRCLRKGVIKVTQAPARRYRYYLTPHGFAEKARLTAEFLDQSFRLFGLARGECASIFADCVARGWGRIALWGTSELAEIAVLVAAGQPVRLVGVVAAAAGVESFAGLPAAATLAAFGAVDAVILVDPCIPPAAEQALRAEIAAERIFAPALLGLTRYHRGGL